MDSYKQDLQLAEPDAVSGKPADRAAPPGEESPTKPVIIVRLIPGGMAASLLLHRSSPNTVPPLKEDLLAVLAERNIVSGINEELLDDLCVRPVYYHVFVIARGLHAETGKDGYVEYLVNTAIDRRPRIGEDGIADYKNLGFVTVVYRNQPLCRIHEAEKGRDGMDIHGNVLEGKYGRSPMNPAGKNTVLSDDQSTLLAAVDGHAVVQAGVVNVIEVLRIDGNVDNATGNIFFTGDVEVRGDVASSFHIACGGSIVVHGSVEGATLEAGTDISVSAGLFGMDKGSVNAGGDIKCKFIQNCSIRATGNIYADSILFSDVQCDGNLELAGSKGALIGGHTRVGGRVVAKSIGTSMHVPTQISLFPGGFPQNRQVEELEEQIAQLSDEILQIVQMQARYEDLNKKSRLNEQQVREVLQAKERYGLAIEQREEAQRCLDQIRLERQPAGSEDCYVECKGKIHTNTRIRIGLKELLVSKSFSGSKVLLSNGNVTSVKL